MKIKYWTLRQVNSPADFASYTLPRQPAWPTENTYWNFKNSLLLSQRVSLTFCCALHMSPVGRHNHSQTGVASVPPPTVTTSQGNCALVSFEEPL